jgi:hypothetical protein
MPLDPNPEQYPPYSNQTYVKVHEQDLKSAGTGTWTIGGGVVSVPNVDYTTQKYSFWGRNPRYEIAQTIDAYKQNTEEFIATDTALTTYLAQRVNTHGESVYNFIKSKVPNQDSNQQFVLGFTASLGGGQNTTYYANSISVEQNMNMVLKAVEVSNGLPIVTPFESGLISDAHASAVEAKNAGEIRDQQLRQSLQSARGVQAAWAAGYTNNYTWDGQSVVTGMLGQLGAAIQT